MKRSLPPNPKLLYMITKANWGGAQKYVFELATNPLIRKDFSVSVVTGDHGELIEKLKQKGVRADTLYVKNSMNPLSTISELRKMVLFFKEERPHIIHINSSKMAFVASLAGKMAGVPYIVFTAHNWTFTEKRIWYIKVILRLLFYIVVALSDRTICVAENVKNSLRAPKFLRKKMVVIYNGVGKVAIKPLPKLSEGSSTKHVVSIGELHPNKAHETVLSILPFIEDVHYHIIGEGKSRKFLETLITKKKLEHKVTLYGHKTNAQSLLPQYDIFLLPSRTEALPYVILEALSAGLPVIARRVGGVPEIIQGISSTALYDDDEELIDLLKQDYTPIKNWKDQRFSVDNMTRKTAFVYNRLIEQNPKNIGQKG